MYFSSEFSFLLFPITIIRVRSCGHYSASGGVRRLVFLPTDQFVYDLLILLQSILTIYSCQFLLYSFIISVIIRTPSSSRIWWLTVLSDRPGRRRSFISAFTFLNRTASYRTSDYSFSSLTFLFPLRFINSVRLHEPTDSQNKHTLTDREVRGWCT